MKVIRESNRSHRPWWVGKRYTCFNFAAITELESSDRDKFSVNAGVVLLDCPCCGAAGTLYVDGTCSTKN